VSEHRAGEDGGGANRPRNILQSQSPGRRGINRESLRQMTVFAKLARNTPLQSRCTGDATTVPLWQPGVARAGAQGARWPIERRGRHWLKYAMYSARTRRR